MIDKTIAFGNAYYWLTGGYEDWYVYKIVMTASGRRVRIDLGGGVVAAVVHGKFL